jgi:hypothetical protein
VVLVHGAFAGSSGWEAVATQLMDQGYPVLAFSNPLRDPISDGAAVRSLVHVAAYALDEGENVGEAHLLGGGHTTVTDHLVLRPIPDQPLNADASIDPAWFGQLFAQDLPARTARFMAASQRPGALSALQTESGPPAWAEIPNWYMVATQDRIIPPEAERDGRACRCTGRGGRQLARGDDEPPACRQQAHPGGRSLTGTTSIHDAGRPLGRPAGAFVRASRRLRSTRRGRRGRRVRRP